MIARAFGLLSLVGLAALPLATRSPERPLPERGRGADVDVGHAVDRVAEVDIEASERDQLLSRWNAFTPREQGELRERFERFKEIDDEERECLQRRGKRLDLMARHLYRELSDEDRERIDAMPSAKRRELLREMAADQARNAGRRIHDKLPPHIRKRLEQASPADRARFMEKYRAARRERMGEALVRLGEELEIEESIIKRIHNLPDDQRGRKFLEFLQRRALVEVGERGLPNGLDFEQWQQIGELPGEEFFEAVMELRETYPALAMPEASIREMDESHRRLIVAGRPRHAERIELSEWSPADRRREITQRRRNRVERVLAEEELLAPEDLSELEGLGDREYLAEVRRRIRALGSEESVERR